MNMHKLGEALAKQAGPLTPPVAPPAPTGPATSPFAQQSVIKMPSMPTQAPQGLAKYLQPTSLQGANTGISGVPNVGNVPNLESYGDQTPGTNYLPYLLGAGGMGLGGLLGNYLGSSKKRNPRTGEMEDEGSTLGTLGGAALGGLGGYMLGQ